MNGISLVICCYNAAGRISQTLAHLQNQQLKTAIPWEVILVDNASTDNTAQLAADIWSRNPVTDLRVLREERPGLMEARKKGFSGAAYEIVSFIDDDNWVETGWVQKVSEVFAMNEKIGACGGRIEAVFEKTKPEWFEKYQNSFAVGSQAEQSGIVDDKRGFLWGAGLSMRKSLWNDLQNRGFKNITLGREGKKITAGEDSELCYAIRLLGYHLYYHDNLVLKHFMPQNRMTINYLVKMSEGFGKAYARLNCYKVLLYTQSFKLHRWWYEWMVAVKNYFVATSKLIWVKHQPARNDLRIKAAYNKGYATQVWIDKSSSQKMIAQLKAVFKK